jgi:acyl transferase domain-containing protein/SAM-dependent methyltransferase
VSGGIAALRPEWADGHEDDEAPCSQRVVFVCDPPAAWSPEGAVVLRSYAISLAERYAAYAMRVFGELRRLLQVESNEPVLVQLVSLGVSAMEFAPALSALLATASAEEPRVRGQVIELEEWPSHTRVEEILRENAARPHDAHVAYRDGQRVVERWREAPESTDPSRSPWRDGGVYLVTGGAGAIGRIVCADVAARAPGARLVVVGRAAHANSLPPGATYHSVDVTHRAAVDALVAGMLRDHGRIDGVIHCAGVIEDGFLVRKSHRSFARVLAPKVAGTLNLDEATRELPLDLFLLFSSAAGARGSEGQCDYATANAFLDAYAVHRSGLAARGLRSGRTVAIGWPLWEAGGMTIDPETRRARRIASLATGDALKLLDRCVSDGCARTLVEVLEVAPERQLVLSTLGKLKELFGAQIKLPAAEIDGGERLQHYGIDSMIVTRINQQLEPVFGPLPKTLLYRHPTLASLAHHLAGEHPAACARWGAGHDAPEGRRREAAPPRRSKATAAREPIAIIGMAGRFPHAPTLDAFWDNLESGRDCIDEIPPDRWQVDGFYEPDLATAVAEGKSYAKWGGFLDGIADFDPLFFDLPPREAAQIDPQERLFLESCWEVIEDAGYTRATLQSRHAGRVGVFAGITRGQFAMLGEELRRHGTVAFPRSSFSSLANRVSYHFDFRGPSMPVDTMCSSSLTALHEACEQLRRGVCELAIAGAVNLYVHPAAYLELCQHLMLSRDGRCRSFGSGGSGFVPGEGVASVLLKPVARAEEDGDRIYAVVRGSAVSHAGRTNGFTVPSPDAQAALIETTLAEAGVESSQVSYVEAHGTGTELGDPIEIDGLSAAFRASADPPRSCVIGSVKSNIGHLEAAAGMAGLVKVVLQMQNRRLVPSLHADELNPNIDFAATPFRVQRTAADWTGDGPRIAGISSFGAGGVNAHVIVEEYLTPHAPSARTPDSSAVLVPISARTPEALNASVERLARFLERDRDVDLADVAYTLQTGREAMEERICFVARAADDLIEKLGAHDGVRGRVVAAKESLAAIEDDPNLPRVIARLIETGKLDRLAALWAKGLPVGWEALHAPGKRRKVRLPTYPFSRRRCWPGESSVVTVRAGGSARDAILEEVADALQVAAHEIDAKRSFADYGLDSILGVRVVEALNRRLGTRLDTTALFDYSSVERLRAHVEAAAQTSPQPRVEHDTRGPIAIIGMSGRFAGSANLTELWDHLRRGDCLVGDVTRWSLDTACRQGSFIEQIELFDPLFFNISGLEAAYMDPQQRLFLEEAWHALEDAGRAGAGLEPDAGVYVGCCAGDYQSLLPAGAPGHALWGNMASVIASRIAYHLDLRGPAIAVDTSCSSSLVALQLACQALHDGDVETALAGGVFVQSTPRLYAQAEAAGMLSATGRCRSFDHRADGFVPGEGVGVVVLKRLDDALRDGDSVHAVIRAIGVNQDGTTNGITAPSAPSQERLLRDVYGSAGLRAADIGMLEAHGTGTPLGDPIEVRALRSVFDAHGAAPSSCALGSIKTNIGHTQFAAGIAGVLKAVLALRHREIPPSPDFEHLNPAIVLEGSAFYVNRELRPWRAAADGGRRAAVSSFGASGTNAHVVIEEAPAPAPRRGEQRDSYLLALSAATEPQLRELARTLVAHCRRHPDIDLGHLCFTLLTGRRHHDIRLGCIVRDLAGVVDSLERWLAGEVLAADERVRRYLVGGVPDAAAEFREADRRRIPLPGYPFKRERYWAGDPLPQCATLRGDEPFVADHRVQGRHVVPGAWTLELACAAVESAGAIRLENVVWLEPLLYEGRPLTVATEASDGRLRVSAGDGTVHLEASPVAVSTPDAPYADLEALRRDCTATIDPADCYSELRAMGIEHGPSLQGIAALYAREGELLARLRAPAGADASVVMLDAAVQASVALHPGGTGTAVPFTIDLFERWSSPGAEMWAHIHDRDGKLDVDLIDPDGRVTTRLRGWSARPIESAACLVLQPVWNPSDPDYLEAIPGHTRVHVTGAEDSDRAALAALLGKVTFGAATQAPFDHLIWIAPPAGDDPVEDQELGVIAFYRCIQQLLRLERDASPLQVTVVTRHARAASPADQVLASHASLHGLAGSLAREYPQWQVRVTDAEADATLSWARILRLPFDGAATPWLLRGGETLRPSLVRVRTARPASSPYRHGGVYVAIGGAGGVGRAWSEWMIRHHDARIVWIGRRDLEQQLAPGIDYIRADAADPDALRAAREQILARHGRVDGVVDAAIVLLDASLATMTEDRFRAALRAKVDVSAHVAEVFSGDALDFLCFFSSIQSFFTAAGQSNYAAGSVFQDELGQQLSRRSGTPVRVVNWGYWGDIGAAAGDEHQRRMARAGQAALDPEEAFATLETALGSPLRQVAIARVTDPSSLPWLDERETVTVHEEARPRVVIDMPAREPPLPIADPLGGLDALLLPMLFAALLRLGLFHDTAPATVDELRERGGIRAPFERWLAHTLAVLAEDGLVRRSEGGWAAVDARPRDSRAAWAAWEAHERSHEGQASTHVRLVDATMRALPQILTGATRATDVIFPDSSFRLVEGVYGGNPSAELFNGELAETLLAYVEARVHRDPAVRLRILEIGAGTGATTAAVLRRLSPHAPHIERYTYTDVSKAFLLHARTHFAREHPYLDCRLFDVEKPPADQDIGLGAYDAVVASNVFHATRSIRNTVRNAKAALAPGGLLLLTELSASALFSHLTFGLLDGWWLYDDEALRIPGSPAVASDTWRRVLSAEGFEDVKVAIAAPVLGQQVIAAFSDGVVRQARTGRRPDGAPQRRAPQLATGHATPAGDSLRERSLSYFRGLVADVLRVPRADIDPSLPLERYGVDSLLVVQLTDALRRVLAPVSSTLLFEVRTVSELVDHLLATRRDELAALVGDVDHTGAPPAPAPAVPASIARPEPTQPGGARSEIAIIGVAGRYPGAESVAELWEVLAAGRDCITEVPQERWSHDRYFSAEKGLPGKTYARWGGFLRDVDKFDPLFFNLSPREAETLDPQERLFLQCAYETLEDAGHGGDRELQRSLGVFVGVMSSEYQLWTANGGPVVSSSLSSIANRVSYFFDAHGPSLAVDTMCSSSLTAIHLACAAIARGECDSAIAGGVNLSLHPSKYLMIGQGQFASTDGRCRSFGAGGDGYVPSEGVGGVLLVPLDKAVASGDQIYGVIRGSAVNHGGRTNGFTVPSPTAQAAAVECALQESGVDARSITYVEAHGTGTALGDPIELNALAKAFGAQTADHGYCSIGSIKSNIGHCESAAGIAGLTKVLLQMKLGLLAPSLHATDPNPHIDFEQTPFVVQQTLAPWNGPRVAGVSAFGAGGSNAHLIVEEHRSEAEDVTSVSPALVVLSARDGTRLREVVARLMAALDGGAFGDADLPSIAFTLQAGREAMEHRLAFAAATLADVQSTLRRWLAGDDGIDGLHRGEARRDELLALFDGDEDLLQAVNTWIDRGRWTNLLEAWVRGVTVDWCRLYRGAPPRRVSLPTYPFARERHWAAPAAPAGERLGVLHPLVHQNTSDFDGLRFTSRFDDALPARPGALFLEMARVAAVLAADVEEAQQWGLRIHEVEWTEEVRTPATLHVTLTPRSELELEFRIHDHETTHAQGRVSLEGVDVPPPVARSALAQDELRVPPGGARDALLVAAAMQMAGAGGHGPFHLRSADFLAPLPDVVRAHCRDSATGHDIDLVDGDGRVCLRLQGLCVPAAPESVPMPDPPWGDLILRPVWDVVDHGPARAATRGRLVVMGGTPEARASVVAARTDAIAADSVEALGRADEVMWLVPHYPAAIGGDALLEATDRCVSASLSFLQSLLQAGHGEHGLALTAVTRNAGSVSGEPIDPAQTAAAALFTTAAKEYPQWAVRLVDVPAPEPLPLEEIMSLPADPCGRLSLYRAGRWYGQRLLPVSWASPTEAAFRDGGVYVIVGGAGSIGQAVTEHLIRTHGAHVVWLGRRERDAAIDRAIDRLAALGPAPQYISVDASDRDALERARDEIAARHVDIHGIFHSAMVFSSRPLQDLSVHELRDTLAAKVATTVRVAEVLGERPLDFIVLFSSLVSFIRNRGQAHYAAACAFADAYASRLGATLPCPVKVMHWGYWGNGTMPEESIEALRLVGVDLIDPAAGALALERLIAGPFDRLGAMKTTRPIAVEGMSTTEVITVRSPPSVAGASGPRAIATRQLPPEMVAHAEETSALDDLLADLLAAHLRVIDEVRPSFERWKARSLRIVAGRPARDLASLWEQWNERRSEWGSDLEAPVRLAEAVLHELPAILTERRAAREILFPGGSLELVEGIYGHNRQADYFNDALCDTLLSYVRQLLRDPAADPLRILEVGAGTGGTTASALERLQPHHARIAEYLYTDVSEAFLRHGAASFGAHRFFVTSMFDVSASPVMQGIEPGAYDVVIAANVLHATCDVRAALGHVKEALNGGGLLLLNEISRESVFNHVTFGLLDEWWAAADPELRMQGCPGLEPASWKRVLESEGFRFVLLPAAEAHDLGQQIVAAHSDGVVRQPRAHARIAGEARRPANEGAS